MDKGQNKDNFNSRMRKLSRKITQVGNWLVDSKNYDLVTTTRTNDVIIGFLVYFEMYKSDLKKPSPSTT